MPASRNEPSHQTIYPQLDYVVETEQRHLPAGNGLPILVEFSTERLRRFGNGQPSLRVIVGKSWLTEDVRAAVEIPAIFETLSKIVSVDFPYCVLLVDRRELARVRQDPGWNEVVVSVEIGPSIEWPDGKRATAASEEAVLAFSKQPKESEMQPTGGQNAGAPAIRPVLIAVLDEGIAFAHERFRTAAGSRIAYFWNQDGRAGPAPYDTFGTELTGANIDSALASAVSKGLADSASVYRAIGELDFARDGHKAISHRRSHGTHVLDLAATLDPSFPPASRPIIAVQMPQRAIADSSGTRLTPFMLLGILYVLLRAQEMAVQRGQRLPVVINLSYGMYAGPHDGSHIFEQIVDLLIGIFEAKGHVLPVHVVIAAGNHRLARAHAEFKLAPATTEILQWRIQPEDRTPSILEIWLPRSAGEVEVTVQPPSALAPPIVVKKNTTIFQNGPLGKIYGASYVDSTVTARAYIVITIEPTAAAVALDVSAPTAPHGVWNIHIKNTSALQLDMNAYIQRDDTIYGRKPMGRQSYFDDGNYAIHDNEGRVRQFDPQPNPSYVSRTGTLNALATGVRTHVIGGYRRTDRMPARYSSMGPAGTRVPPRAMKAPNWLAPSDDSAVCHGVLAAGTSSGSRVTMNGTSVAAPQAARWIADQLAQGKAPIPAPPQVLIVPSQKVPASNQLSSSGDGLLVLQGPSETGNGPLLLRGRNARP